MTYIRIKKIRKEGKEYRYAYLVENKWKKKVRKGSIKGARQKVKGYLGKVHEFPRVEDKQFNSHFSVQDLKPHLDERGAVNVLKDFIRLELINHGFSENGDFYANGELVVYLGDEFFIKNVKEERGKKLVICMNEGFLCKETFEKLINFEPKGIPEEVGMNFGNALLEAGLKVPTEAFVEIFNKIVE